MWVYAGGSRTITAWFQTVAINLGGFPDSDKIIMIFVSTPQLTTGILNLIRFYFLYEL